MKTLQRNPSRPPLQDVCRRLVAFFLKVDSVLDEDSHDVDAVLRRLREQEESARQAGCRTVGDLCTAILDSADDLRREGHFWMAAMMSSLLDHVPAVCLNGKPLQDETDHTDTAAASAAPLCRRAR